MHFSVDAEGDGGAETGPAGGTGRIDAQVTGVAGFVLPALHLGEETGDVGGGILLGTAVAGGMDAGIAAQDVHLETGVIGKTVQAGPFVDIPGLLQGVGPEGVSGFGDIFGDADLGGRDEFEPFAQNFLRFPQFAGVAGGKNNLHRHSFVESLKDTPFFLNFVSWHTLCVYPNPEYERN